MVVVSSNFAAPVDGILFHSPSTKLLVNDREIGTGNLYITQNNVVWGGGVRPSGTPASTISLLYPTISMHAVQREPSAALFMVLNYDLSLPELANQSGSGDNVVDEDDEFDPEDQPITQLRFVPQNEGDLQAMYSAMSQGQSMHPDPADEVDEDDPYMDGEEGDEEFEDAEESAMAPDDAATRLRHMRLEQANGNPQHEDTEEAEIAEE